MNKKLKWTLIIIGILVGIFLVMKLVGGGGDSTEKVATEKVTRRTIIETVSASGKIYPEVEVKISPDISGQITELNVEEGDSVKKGEVLARIYADIYALQRDEAASRVNQSVATVENSKAALDALEANLTQARQTLDRNQKLYDQKVISKAELEQYEVAYRTAEANLAAARANIKSLQAGVQSTQTGLNKANKDLSRTTIVSPMNGVISSLKVKKGESVAGSTFNVGTEMMTVADMSVIEVRVDVNENDIVKINIGDSADVKVDAYDERKFKGIVTKISSSTGGSAMTNITSNDVTNYEVRIRLDKSSYADLANNTFPFRPGMNASAEIKTNRVESVTSVPIGAVTTRVKGTDQSLTERKEANSRKTDEELMNETPASDDDLEIVVFVVTENGVVRKKAVTAGIQDLSYIEIKTGLKDGETVATEPFTVIQKNLKDSMKVKVVSKEKLYKN